MRESTRTLARVRGPAANPARCHDTNAGIEVHPPCDAHSRVRVKVIMATRETWIDLSTAEARALAYDLMTCCDVPDAS